MTVTGFRHAGVTVRDMNVSLAFYVEFLGLKLISDRRSSDGGRFIGFPEASARICLLEIPGSNAHIELLEYHGAGGAPGTNAPADFGTGHASFWVQDLDRLYERFVAENIRVLTPPIEPPSGRKKFYARDPDGYGLELTEAPSAADLMIS
jgi:lactoylglutathione lyase